MKRAAYTVIYTHGGGRLGNQIIRWAHWLAWARAHAGAVEIINLGFWPYARYFAAWRENPGCAFPSSSRLADLIARGRAALPAAALARVEQRFPRFVHAAGQFWPCGQAIALDDANAERMNLDDPAFFARIARQRVTMCSGWNIASWRLVAEQQIELRDFFRPAPDYARRGLDFIARLRQRFEMVVGVLIRQSDYRIWHDGRFCFPTGRYVTWMRQLLDLHPGKRIAFVVASEERQDLSLFGEIPVFFSSGSVNLGGHWFDSWIELSNCDFVVSPPSTFAATAAFVGALPLWPILSIKQNMAVDQIMSDGMIGAARHPIFSLAVQ